MMDNIRLFTAEPHHSGSPEIQLVRAQIIAEIEGMGLTPILQDYAYTKHEMVDNQLRLYGVGSKDELWEQVKDWAIEYRGIHSIDELIDHSWAQVANGSEDGTLHLQNILVKLDAPDTEHGVMFVSHYDSVPDAPGAGDVMVGVCAMLEALRAHAQTNALESSLYFLFTDGEELGMLGASAFVNAHPELKAHIDMVINLEGRGNRGGLVLFETSPESYSLLRAAKRSGAKPIGFSWLATVYAMMPNNTDLTVFLEAGYQGINFAMGEGVEHYHMPTDSYENLNKNSAWQYLRTTLAFADYAAHNTTDELRRPSQDAVYFPFMPGFMVLMSAFVSHLLGTAACVLALAFVVREIANKQLRICKAIHIGLLVLMSIITAIFFPFKSSFIK
jgi:hypothetical protein